MKSKAGLRLGIVNPLTLVGNEIKSILRDRSFPAAKVALLDSSGENAGAVTEINEEPTIVAPVSQIELEDLDLVFFCGPAARNHDWIERHAEDNFVAVDLSQPSTVEDGTLAVAGINLDDVAGERVIISPHPVAIPIALLLHQIEKLAPVEICTATVIQPASEFEEKGVEELAKQTISVLNVQSIPKEVFDRQAAFNLYPAIEHHEEFIVRQVRSLTDPRAQLALFITQGTIFHNHTFSLFFKTREKIDAGRVTSALHSNPVFAFPEGDQAFGTIDAAGRDEVLIANVRDDPASGGFWVWAVCDNLRRGSALNAVLIAEKVLFDSGVN